MALPQQRRCRITDALPCLENREHYRQAVLIVETGVSQVRGCVECSPNSATKKIFGGCFGDVDRSGLTMAHTRGPGEEVLLRGGGNCRQAPQSAAFRSRPQLPIGTGLSLVFWATTNCAAENKKQTEEREGGEAKNSEKSGQEGWHCPPLRWAEGRTGGQLSVEEGGEWPAGLLSCSSKDLRDMWVEPMHFHLQLLLPHLIRRDVCNFYPRRTCRSP